MTIKSAKELDKFYTKPSEVQKALRRTAYLCHKLNIRDPFLIEPSAGNGAFLISNPYFSTIHGFDIAPEANTIQKADFLLTNLTKKIGSQKKQTVYIGNPPFGKKGKLAAEFLNKSLQEGTLTGFVLPAIFRKWMTQRSIMPSAHLIADFDMPADAFTLKGEEYSVRCCFQLWSPRPVKRFDNIRLQNAPEKHHPEFDIWQYNATKQAEKYFDYTWDFAVLRQGYGNYNTHHLPKDKDTLSRKKQWIFFKAHNPKALARLKSIDFNALAQTNTSVHGFGKTEIVHHYRTLFENLTPHPQTQNIEQSSLKWAQALS